jgi:hypothetical protein
MPRSGSWWRCPSSPRSAAPSSTPRFPTCVSRWRRLNGTSELNGMSHVLRTWARRSAPRSVSVLLATSIVRDPSGGPAKYPTESAYLLALGAVSICAALSILVVLALPRRPAEVVIPGLTRDPRLESPGARHGLRVKPAMTRHESRAPFSARDRGDHHLVRGEHDLRRASHDRARVRRPGGRGLADHRLPAGGLGVCGPVVAAGRPVRPPAHGAGNARVFGGGIARQRACPPNWRG